MVALLNGAGREHASRVPHLRIAGRADYWLWLLVVLVVIAVAQRRLGPSSSATTSTTDRALPSSAVQLRCWSRPMITTRLPLASDSLRRHARDPRRPLATLGIRFG
jgi:hypothetical protein